MSLTIPSLTVELVLSSRPRVAIIVLNWNSWRQTIECLQRLIEISYPSYCIVVVDNGSQDGSSEKIAEWTLQRFQVVGTKERNYFYKGNKVHVREFFVVNKNERAESAKSLSLLECNKNFGFVEGNNIGIIHSLQRFDPDYILLLNNDCIVDRYFLEPLVTVGQRRAEVGIIGPMVYYYDYHGRRDVINFLGENLIIGQVKGMRYRANEIDSGRWTPPLIVDKIDGCCILIKRSVIQDIGLLVAEYFAYWEETDYCWRAKKKGYIVVCVPSSKVWHKIGTSIGGIYSPRRIYYLTRNRFIFAKRHLTRLYKISFLIYFLGFEAWFDALLLIRYKKIEALRSFIEGIISGLKCLLNKGQAS